MIETPASTILSQHKLRLQNVSRVFQTPRGPLTAIEDITLEVQEGEFVCVLGPSGCGKSTMLNLIAGLDKPTSGEIGQTAGEWKARGPTASSSFKNSVCFRG